MNDKDILMKELQELKISLEQEVNRVTKIIDHLTKENDAHPALEDVKIQTEVSNEHMLFSLVKIQIQKKISKPSYETWLKDVFVVS
ncbi:hypothetical protein [Peribacillus sp. SI8-4]|uniref:hypothetical protein n=1 Tax=Peribacillus sp. SI8-4 TaxID=3048009 RepID=UPI0025550BEE|nr:hypothetical protein [Peribacillus sp. SI8-4]